MMGWFRYPYTDLHELNLDWVISKLKEIELRLTNLKAEILQEAHEDTVEYVDSVLEGFISEFNELKAEFAALINNFNSLDSDFITLKNTVNSQIAALDQKINADILGVNQSVDIKLQNMYERIFSDLSDSLSQIKVINYFNGEKISIQDMFNTLAMLHLNDSIDYDTMAYRAKTYTEFATMNMTFSNLIAHGNTLYI